MTELHRGHMFDDDACCVDCGFDGAEWSHWRNYTYEGKASPGIKQPLCTKIGRKRNMWLEWATDWEEDYWREESC